MDALVVDAASDGAVSEPLPVVRGHPHEDPLGLDGERDVDGVRREELLDGRDRLGLRAARVELGADLGGEQVLVVVGALESDSDNHDFMRSPWRKISPQLTL